jgi:MSHA biogenesis protein MshQ
MNQIQSRHDFFILLQRVSVLLILVSVRLPLQAAPGDIIARDNFERTSLGSAWTVVSSDGDAGLGTHTAQSGSRSLYTRWGRVQVISRAVDLSAYPAVELSLWIREGSDAFSEDPESSNENLNLAFLDLNGNWVTLLDYAGNAYPGGNIITPVFRLPETALHANFRLRIQQTGGDGRDWDYYHLDDITLTEREAVESIVGGFCDDFESGLGNWQVSATSGEAAIGNQTAGSPDHSLYLRSGRVAVQSVPVDLRAGEGEFSYWVRRGADSFSEDPDSGEDLLVEYLDSSGGWTQLDRFAGNGSAGQIFSVTHVVPADARHDRLRLRFTLLAGSRSPLDYWHVDDVCLHVLEAPTEYAYYALDETDPSVLQDGSDNGHTATGLGSVSMNNPNPVRSGDPGTCGYLEVPDNTNTAITDAVDTGIDVDRDLGNAGSIAFWYNSNVAWDGHTGDRQLFDASGVFSGNGTGQKYFSLTLQDNPRLRFAVEDTTDNDFEVTTAYLNYRADAWIHITTTWDLTANRLQIYLDGSLAAAGSIGSNGRIGDVDTLYFGDNRSSYLARATGNSANGSFDEIRIFSRVLSQIDVQSLMGATHGCVYSANDHYTISYSGTGVTCEAEPVTIISHDDSHTEVAPSAGTVLTVSAVDALSGNLLSSVSWSGAGITDLGNGQARYVFDGTETRVILELGITTEALINIDVGDGYGITEHSGSADEPDNDLAFSAAALHFYADGVISDIHGQIAGKASNIDPGAQTLSLRAVTTNTLTGACDTRLSGLQSVELAFQCLDPGTCKTPNGVTINGTSITGNPAGGVGTYSTVTLDFGSTGTAALVLQYADAGQIQLHARKFLPASGSDPALTLSGSSNPFAVVPAGLCVQSRDAEADCTAPYHDCSRFIAAGQDFNLTVQAVGWEAAGEEDTDFCTGNAVTPNFRLGNIDISHSLVAPASGAAGNIAVSGIDIVAADDGTHNLMQRVSEVGVFRFSAIPPSYFGETLAASSSDVIGRFYPSDFRVSVNAHGSLETGCGSFTYTGQPIGYAEYPELLVTARNVAGATTRNYTGDFRKLSAGNGSLVSFTAPSADATQMGKDLSNPTALSATVNSNLANLIDHGDGTLGYPLSGTDVYVYLRNANALIAPYSADVDLPLSAVVDGDGVRDDGTAVLLEPLGSEIRFGRLVLDDAFGPQTDPLMLPLRTQYFDGSGFVDNSEDYCTRISPTAAASLGNWQDDLSAGETQVSSAADVLAGRGEITLSAPGLGSDADSNDGSVDLSLDLSLTTPAQSWLLNDENADGAFAENPLGTASFGMFRGDDRILYWREVR